MVGKRDYLIGHSSNWLAKWPSEYVTRVVSASSLSEAHLMLGYYYGEKVGMIIKVEPYEKCD